MEGSRRDSSKLYGFRSSTSDAFRDSILESQSAIKFLEEIEQFFAKNEKAETSNLLGKAQITQNKKRKKIKGVAKGSSQRKKLKKNEEFTCYFCKKSGHMKKQCPKYAAWRVKKDTWWLDSRATTHISLTMQGFLWSRPPNDYERFIFVGDDNKVAVETSSSLLKLKLNFNFERKFKAIKSDRGGEYYDRYDRSREQRPGPFALFLKECGIVPQYTMPGKPSMNGVAERRNWTLKDMSHFGEKL
ncbi:hypothetical protein CR513_12065, partial [Mucuna pruriens]